MNKVVAMGRLLNDPTQQDWVSGSPSVVFDFAIEEPDKVVVTTVIVYGYSIDFVMKYLKKGKKILLEGKLHQFEKLDNNGNIVVNLGIQYLSSDFAESLSSEENKSNDYNNSYIKEPYKPARVEKYNRSYNNKEAEQESQSRRQDRKSIIGTLNKIGETSNPFDYDKAIGVGDDIEKEMQSYMGQVYR